MKKIVNDDFKDFIALLNKHNVDYCITGAYAVSFHSKPLELSNGLSGLSENEIMKHRVKDKYGDITAYYIGIDELIRNKGIVKDLPHRVLRKGQDDADYKTLKFFKGKKRL